MIPLYADPILGRMNRIDQIFRELRCEGRKALMPFITAGDPDLATTAALAPAIQRAGAAICELGVAFSDPIADGPVIQESMTHALHRGIRPQQIFETIDQVRPNVSMGLVLMVSFSIVYRMGVKAFVDQARQSGVDGFIFPDLPVEEAPAVRDVVAEAGLIASFLIAPSTPIDRAERIAAASSGFVYLLSRGGLTGERSELPSELPDTIGRLRAVTDLPIAVGFGISSPRHVEQVVGVADAAIVGSAIVRRLAPYRNGEVDVVSVTSEIESLVGQLATGLDG